MQFSQKYNIKGTW